MEIIEVLKGLLTPIIAIVTSYIAIQQYRSSTYETRRELYDRRMSVYKAIMDYISTVVVSGKINNIDKSKLLVNTSEAIFLFRKDVTDYIDILLKKGNELWKYNMMIERHINNKKNTEDVEKISKKEGELFEWFTNQFEVAQVIFKKYLTLDK